MLDSIVSNSRFWKRLAARDMTFGSHVGAHIPNIGYMKVHEGFQALGGISSFQASNFTSNAFQIMSGDLLGPEI